MKTAGAKALRQAVGREVRRMDYAGPCGQLAFTPSDMGAVESSEQGRDVTRLKCSLLPSGCCRGTAVECVLGVGSGRTEGDTEQEPGDVGRINCTGPGGR